jgi:hypothetical protein
LSWERQSPPARPTTLEGEQIDRDPAQMLRTSKKREALTDVPDRREQRQDRRLEDHPQQPDRALHRPHRSKLDQLTSMTATATHTKKLTVSLRDALSSMNNALLSNGRLDRRVRGRALAFGRDILVSSSIPRTLHEQARETYETAPGATGLIARFGTAIGESTAADAPRRFGEIRSGVGRSRNESSSSFAHDWVVGVARGLRDCWSLRLRGYKEDDDDDSSGEASIAQFRQRDEPDLRASHSRTNTLGKVKIERRHLPVQNVGSRSKEAPESPPPSGRAAGIQPFC